MTQPTGNSLTGFSAATTGLVPTLSAELKKPTASEDQPYLRPRTEGLKDYAAFMLDPDGKIVNWDSAAERMKGYHSSEIIGRHFSCFYTPEDVRQGKPDTELRLAQSEGKYEEEGWRIRKDGSRFRARVLITALHDDSGRLCGFAKMTRDMTSQYAEEVERALLDSEARTHAILATAVDAIITIDEKGLVESLNPAAERLFGYRVAELIGQNVNVLMPEPFHREHDGHLANYRATGQKKIIGIGRQVVGRRKDGTTFPMDLAVSEVRLGDRRIFTGIVRDISERIKVEDELRRYAAQLQECNAELTRSNQELDDFAYIASHDLKEPLRGIHNYATFLIQDYHEKLDEEGQSKLQTLRRLTQRLESLLDSLLEFSRVGRVDLAVGTTDLDKLLAGVLDSLRITLQEQAIAVRITERLPTIQCDRVRVAEVFRNLITNSMKYNDKSEKWIEVGFNCNARADKSPIFYVRDNGIGIREKHFESVFRIFKRLHSREKFGGGSGVGLTIVKKIIERHGGRIWVESELGQGTTFYFILNGDQS